MIQCLFWISLTLVHRDLNSVETIFNIFFWWWWWWWWCCCCCYCCCGCCCSRCLITRMTPKAQANDDKNEQLFVLKQTVQIFTRRPCASAHAFLRRIFYCLPLILFPCGFQVRACLVILLPSILRTCPVQIRIILITREATRGVYVRTIYLKTTDCCFVLFSVSVYGDLNYVQIVLDKSILC